MPPRKLLVQKRQRAAGRTIPLTISSSGNYAISSGNAQISRSLQRLLCGAGANAVVAATADSERGSSMRAVALLNQGFTRRRGAPLREAR